MKLYQLIEPNFKNFLNQLVNEKLPLKATVKLFKVVNKINETDDKGNIVTNEHNDAQLLKGKEEAFKKELLALQQKDVTLPKLSVKDFGDNLMISANEFALINQLISLELKN